MNYNAFRSLVNEMRVAQRDYFRERVPENLSRAKALEKRVDEELRSNGQKSLLDPEEQLQALRSQHNGSIPPEGKGCFAIH